MNRLWQQQGKRAEASRVPSDIYGRFTESFGTADLKEVKALLDELRVYSFSKSNANCRQG